MPNDHAHFALPEPDSEALAHSHRLCQLIANEITANNGVIGFDHFMQLALYAPGLGYYSAGLSKFGAAGDFVTAPEISPLFAHAFATQIQEIQVELATPYTILEFGAGSGRLAADLLFSLQQKDCLPSEYLIMEVSADLRERQRLTLLNHCPQLVDRVVWLDSLPSSAFDGVILANEVLDAMPVKRFACGESPESDQALGVTLRKTDLTKQNTEQTVEQRFDWQTLPASAPLSTFLTELRTNLPHSLPAAYRSEWNPGLQAWISGLADLLQRGVIFCVDYGESRREYYHPDRLDGTLLCHYRHRAHSDPFKLVGLQDLTASVDFTAVAEAALQAGLDVDGYTSQAFFLLNNGLLEALEGVIAEHGEKSEAYLHAAQAVKRLTLPEEMGERFKVIAMSKAYDATLRGFTRGDQRERL